MAEIKCSVCGSVYKSKRGETVSACPVCETKNAVEETKPNSFANVRALNNQPLEQPVMQMPKEQAKDAAQRLVEQAMALLKAGNFDDAAPLLDEALNKNEKCAHAYVGKLMIEYRCPTQEDLKNCQSPFDRSDNYHFAIRYADNALANTLRGYITAILNKEPPQKRKEKKKKEIVNAQGVVIKKKPLSLKTVAIIGTPVLCLLLAFLVVLGLGVFDSPKQKQYIAAGRNHTVGLKKDGTVVAVGDNDDGQCNVSGWTDIVAVTTGNSHTVGLKKDGTVVAVGYNSYEQCNVSDWKDIVAVAAGFKHTVGLKKDGTVVAVGYNDGGRCDVSGWTDIVAVTTGNSHNVGLKKDGTVVAVGYNYRGQCNVSDWKDITAVAAGDDHTVGLKKDGTVVAVGSNDYGQCNVTDWTDIVAVAAGRGHTVGLKKDGTVVAVGSNYSRQCDVSDWTDIVAVAAGEAHTVGLKKDGTVVAVGYNDNGQCNVSSFKNIKQPQ